MCGASVFPATPTTPFVFRPYAAAADVSDGYNPPLASIDVTEVGSPPPPSTPPPSGWSSSLKTGAAAAPPHGTMAESYWFAAYAELLSKQQLMAGATRGLLAAEQQQQMARRPYPDRQGSPSATRGGAAPVPLDPLQIKMRVVPNTTTMMPAADVIDAGSSAPSTPSPRSSSSSSSETTPSPRGPLSPSLSDDSACASSSQHLQTPTGAASGLATKTKPPPMAPSLSVSSAAPCASQHPLTPGSPWGLRLATKPPLPFPPAPRVEVRQVWAHNFEQEAKLIESLLPRFRYAAVDTKFPGTVYRPAAYTLTPAGRYKLLRYTVDALHPIQLGLTLFDSNCQQLSGGATPTGAQYVWEFNFSDFDVRSHPHAPESVAALRARGVDLDRMRRDGVDAAEAFGPRLRKWVRTGGLGRRAGVVTSTGGYDLAYLVKMMHGPGLYRMPLSAAEFEAVAGSLLHRSRVFDVREMAKLCPTHDLRRGLDSVAAKLNVAMAAGEACQAAGYDSLLTCYTFLELREMCFDDDDGKLASVDGILAEITAF